MKETPKTAQERAAVAVWLLCGRGEAMTIADMAIKLDMSYSGAKKLLYSLSRVVPILSIDGRWRGYTFDNGRIGLKDPS